MPSWILQEPDTLVVFLHGTLPLFPRGTHSFSNLHSTGSVSKGRPVATVWNSLSLFSPFLFCPPPDERWLSPNVGGNHVCIASGRDLAASIVQIEVILWLCQAIWNNAAYAVLCLSSPMTAVTAWISMQADWPGRVRGLLADWSCCYLRSLRTRGPSDGRDGRVPEAAGDGRVRLPELAQWWWRGKPLTSASSMMVTNTNFNKFYTFFWWNLTWSYIELTLTLCCFLKSTLAAVRTGICAILVLVHDEGVSCDSSVYTWGYFCQREWGIFKKKKIQ